jgi:hypothetical protein
MSARSFIVVQPDGTAERVTCLPTGLHSEPAKVPKPERAGPAARTLAPYDPNSPGWATPPWPTARVSHETPQIFARGARAVLRTSVGEMTLTYDESLALAADLLRVAASLPGQPTGRIS